MAIFNKPFLIYSPTAPYTLLTEFHFVISPCLEPEEQNKCSLFVLVPSPVASRTSTCCYEHNQLPCIFCYYKHTLNCLLTLHALCVANVSYVLPVPSLWLSVSNHLYSKCALDCHIFFDNSMLQHDAHQNFVLYSFLWNLCELCNSTTHVPILSSLVPQKSWFLLPQGFTTHCPCVSVYCSHSSNAHSVHRSSDAMSCLAVNCLSTEPGWLLLPQCFTAYCVFVCVCVLHARFKYSQELL